MPPPQVHPLLQGARCDEHRPGVRSIPRPGRPRRRAADLPARRRGLNAEPAGPRIRAMSRCCSACHAPACPRPPLAAPARPRVAAGSGWRGLAFAAATDRSGDAQEREAEHAADRVLAAPASAGGARPTVVGARAAPPALGAGRALDAATRAYFEPRFGADFAAVRVHADPAADASARAFDALAYAVGPHIAFRAGHYDPHGAAGRRLLAHELAHTVQQAGGRRAAAPGLPALGAAAPRPARQPAGGYQYRVGDIPGVPDWNYVAFRDQGIAHLRYFSSARKIEIGTIGWATNNPGNADYRWPGDPKSGAAAVPSRRADGSPDPAVYEKDPLDRLYRRFAIFRSAEEGRAALLPMLVRFVGGADATASVEEALARFKGKEEDDSDLRLLGLSAAEIARLTPGQKRRIVRDAYIKAIRGHLHEALAAEDATRSEAQIAAKIDALLASRVAGLAAGSTDAGRVVGALLRQEGSRNLPGVEYACGGEITVLDAPGLSAEQDEVAARLVGPQRAQVVAHLEAVLGCAAR